jgi:hypothetical protein
LVSRLAWQFQTIEVSVRDQDELGLPTLVWSHSRIPIGGVRFFRIHGETGFRVAAMAIETKATSDVERQYHTITLLDTLYRVAHVVDYAHDFVADHCSLIQWCAAVVHLEITATDPTRCDPE